MINIRNYLRTIYDYASFTRAFTVIENAINGLIKGQEWVDYTPTLTGANVGSGDNEARYRISGETLHLHGAIRFNSGSVTALVAIPLPSGVEMKSDILRSNFGVCHFYDSSDGFGAGFAYALSKTSFRIVLSKTGSTTITPWSNTWIGTGTSGAAEVYYNLTIPVDIV